MKNNNLKWETLQKYFIVIVAGGALWAGRGMFIQSTDRVSAYDKVAIKALERSTDAYDKNTEVYKMVAQVALDVADLKIDMQEVNKINKDYKSIIDDHSDSIKKLGKKSITLEGRIKKVEVEIWH